MPFALPHEGKIVPHPDPTDDGWVVMRAVHNLSHTDYFYEDQGAFDTLEEAKHHYPTYEVMVPIGIVEHVDTSRSIDWSVPDSSKYQEVVDARHIVHPIKHAFLVPSAYWTKHTVDWGGVGLDDLRAAGCPTTIFHPHARHSARKQTMEDVWSEHSVFTRAEWGNEVVNNDTQLGYWDWVTHKTEQGCPRCHSSETADLTPLGNRTPPTKQCDRCHFLW